VGPSTGASVDKKLSPLEGTASLSMFSNSQKFNVESVNIDSSQHVHHVQGNRIDGTSMYIFTELYHPGNNSRLYALILTGWKMLLKNIASNALHDSSARFDPPKCDEDTRVEVTKELMVRSAGTSWMNFARDR
jgi:hypothetical protein